MLRSSREGPTEEKTGGRMPIRLGTALIAAAGLLLGPLALAASAATVPHAAVPHATTYGGSYTSVTPFRLVDTRTGATDPATYAGKTLAAASTLNVQVSGVGAVPAAATAAVLNVTETNATASSFLTLFPEGGTQPAVSNLNFTAKQTVANLVTVALSSAGGVTVFNHAGSADVVIDVEGYYTAATSGSLYNAITPVRALGSLAAGTAIAAAATQAVTVTGTTTGVPSNATAVVGNLTAAGATAASFLTVYPAGATQPTASNLNFGVQKAGQAIANRVTVGIGTGGQIEIFNHAGTVNVDFDVDGYYGPTGSYFVPITPVRVADTRVSMDGSAIAAGTSEAFNLATVASGIPASATAVATNDTVVAGAANGFLTEYPTSAATVPVASDVNWTANGIVPNFTIADTAGTGFVEVYNGPASGGATVNLVIDAFGYFTTAAPIITIAASAASVVPGGTSTITATVISSTFGFPDAVLFTESGTCGTFPGAATSVAGSVASSGASASTTYTAGTTAGACVITATEADGGNAASVTVTTTAAVNTVTPFTATPSTLAANGTNTSTLSAAVAAASAGSADNDAVTFTTAGTPAAACGTVTAVSGTTGASGTNAVTATYTASSTPGFCTVTAKEAINGSTATVTIDQTSYPTPVVGQLTFAGGAITGTVVGSIPTTQTEGAAVTYTVTVNPALVGDPFTFVATNGTGTCGTVTPSATTAVGGVASFTYTAGTTTGTCLIEATEADTTATATLTVTQTGAANSIALAPAGLTILGTGGIQIYTVTVTAGGSPVSADAGLVLKGVGAVCPAGLGAGVALTTNSSGVAAYAYTASSTVGFCQLTASDTSTGTSNTATVDQNG